jgi:hypothetical protein
MFKDDYSVALSDSDEDESVIFERQIKDEIYSAVLYCDELITIERTPLDHINIIISKAIGSKVRCTKGDVRKRFDRSGNYHLGKGPWKIEWEDYLETVVYNTLTGSTVRLNVNEKFADRLATEAFNSMHDTLVSGDTYKFDICMSNLHCNYKSFELMEKPALVGWLITDYEDSMLPQPSFIWDMSIPLPFNSEPSFITITHAHIHIDLRLQRNIIGAWREQIIKNQKLQKQ